MRWKWRMRWHRNQQAYWLYAHRSRTAAVRFLMFGETPLRYRKSKAPKGKARVGGFEPLRTGRRVWDV